MLGRRRDHANRGSLVPEVKQDQRKLQRERERREARTRRYISYARGEELSTAKAAQGVVCPFALPSPAFFSSSAHLAFHRAQGVPLRTVFLYEPFSSTKRFPPTLESPEGSFSVKSLLQTYLRCLSYSRFFQGTDVSLEYDASPLSYACY